jgi:hypothetical protein
MRDVRQMTPDEVRDTVRTMATGFAAEHYKRQRHVPRFIDRPNFGRSDYVDHEAPAWAWAADHWQEFEARAVDALALIAADQEATRAAPTN